MLLYSISICAQKQSVSLRPSMARTGIVWRSGSAGHLKRLEHPSQPALPPGGACWKRRFCFGWDSGLATVATQKSCIPQLETVFRTVSLQTPPVAKLEMVPRAGPPHMEANKPIPPTHTPAARMTLAQHWWHPAGSRRKWHWCHTYRGKSSSATWSCPVSSCLPTRVLFVCHLFPICFPHHTVTWRAPFYGREPFCSGDPVTWRAPFCGQGQPPSSLCLLTHGCPWQVPS